MRGEGIHDDLTYLAEARCGRWLGDRWLLARVLGVGGTSAVYEATHRNGRRAALKVLHPQWAMMPTARRRFLREGYISNRVEHPAVAAVLDDGETADGEAYLVLELLEGESLAAVLAQAGRLPVERAVALAQGVLEVLAAAHEKGIIHRDIKPDNLMVLPGGSLKVLDFGIASVKTADASATLATQPGGARGTPAYMAPEQARGQPVDARTDLWAVGAVLFRMLSGQPVRQAPSPEAMLVQAATQPAPALQHVLPGAPPGLAALVDRALSFEPRGRFDTAREMLAALRATGSPVAPSAENATLPEGAPAHDDAPRSRDDAAPPDDPTTPRPLDAHRTIEAAPLDAVSLARSGGGASMPNPDAYGVPVAAGPGAPAVAPAEPEGLALVAPPSRPSPASRRWALAALAAGLALAALLARPLLAGPAAPASSSGEPLAAPAASPAADPSARTPPSPAASAPTTAALAGSAAPPASAPPATAPPATGRAAPRPSPARSGAPAPATPPPAATGAPAQVSATPPPDPFPFRKRH